MTHPVQSHNLKAQSVWNSPAGRYDAISRDSMLLLGDIGGGVRRVPALKIAKWNFTGVSEM